MLSAFSRSLAPARPLRRALTLTVALALGALPVGASVVAPSPSGCGGRRSAAPKQCRHRVHYLR